jgi:hypothetical protein
MGAEYFARLRENARLLASEFVGPEYGARLRMIARALVAMFLAYAFLLGIRILIDQVR